MELLARRSSYNLRGAIWFNLQDVEVERSSDFWGYHTGLLRANGSEKPAWSTFYRGAREGF